MLSLKHALASLVTAITLATLAPSPAAAATPATHVDADGGQDNPLIRRFTGSWLSAYRVSDWEQTQFPSSMAVKDDKFVAPVTVEGKLTRLFYVGPAGKTPLEVYRNYEQALTAAGFKRKFSCESACGPLYFGMYQALDYTRGMTWAQGTSTNGPIGLDQGRLWYGTLLRDGREVHVLLYTSLDGRDANSVATFLQIVEPKAMPTGQVAVDAGALGKGLQADGKIAIYGLYFDTAKVAIKPESSAQLSEIAKLLQAQPAMHVYIVGHTDNQGSPESNMTLSLQRAQAVATALATDYKVDARRLTARGVGSLAPVANNAAEEGRGRNRRVELVLP